MFRAMSIFTLWLIMAAGLLAACSGPAASEDSADSHSQVIDSFEACVQAGNPVLESYPRQCRAAGGQLFVEEVETGVLEGGVTIGPFSPVARQGAPEPSPAPEVYAGRKIVIYAEDGQQELTRVDIDGSGNYRVTLPVGVYVVDINHLGIDHSKDLPQKVEIKSQQTTRLDVNIDTGIR